MNGVTPDDGMQRGGRQNGVAGGDVEGANRNPDDGGSPPPPRPAFAALPLPRTPPVEPAGRRPAAPLAVGGPARNPDGGSPLPPRAAFAPLPPPPTPPVEPSTT